MKSKDVKQTWNKWNTPQAMKKKIKKKKELQNGDSN